MFNTYKTTFFLKNTISAFISYIYSAFILTVNVALNKPAYQEYPLLLGNDTYIYDANNAVDGRKTNMSWYGGQCAVSALYKRTATWWVNLTSVHSIHHIDIYFIKGNAPFNSLLWFKQNRKNTLILILNEYFDFTCVLYQNN